MPNRLLRFHLSTNNRATLTLLAAILSPSLPLEAQKVASYSIVTIAGNGTAGYVPGQDGGLATLAQLDEPYGTAVDAAGNVYIADKATHRIRKVSAKTGIITTIAGNGSAGYASSQDGHAAIFAQLNEPQAIAVDAVGNLYIADTRNHRVRKVDTTGIITTVAGTGTAGYRSSQEGGPATDAQLDSPRGLAIDAAGNLYVADYNSSRIHKIASGTASITTVAGTGTPGYCSCEDGGPATAAELNHPLGVTADHEGNLYIADTDNHRIRRVDAASSKIATVAGNGSAGYNAHDESGLATRAALNAPTDITVDANGNLYIADYNNNRIRKVSAASRTIKTVAGIGLSGYIASQDGAAAASARLNKPRGITIDSSGNLYIADYSNSRIRKMGPLGTLYLAGN